MNAQTPPHQTDSRYYRFNPDRKRWYWKRENEIRPKRSREDAPDKGLLAKLSPAQRKELEKLLKGVPA